MVKEQQRRGATEPLPNLLRAHFATNGTAGGRPPTSCRCLRPTNAAARHTAEPGLDDSPAADQAAALQLVLSEETINFALAALFNILIAGVTFILYGLAVAWSRTYPRWLGWIVVVAGAGSILAGLIQAAAGEPTTITRVLTIIFPTVITLWLVEMNILVLRKASAL